MDYSVPGTISLSIKPQGTIISGTPAVPAVVPTDILTAVTGVAPIPVTMQNAISALTGGETVTVPLTAQASTVGVSGAVAATFNENVALTANSVLNLSSTDTAPTTFLQPVAVSNSTVNIGSATSFQGVVSFSDSTLNASHDTTLPSLQLSGANTTNVTPGKVLTLVDVVSDPGSVTSLGGGGTVTLDAAGAGAKCLGTFSMTGHTTLVLNSTTQGASVTAGGGSTVRGKGISAGDLIVTDAIVNPQGSIAPLGFGTFTSTSATTLLLEFKPTTGAPGLHASKLVVARAATLQGTLQMVPVAARAPAPGNLGETYPKTFTAGTTYTYEIVTAGHFQEGIFSTLIAPDIGTYTLSYENDYKSLMLNLTIGGVDQVLESATTINGHALTSTPISPLTISPSITPPLYPQNAQTAELIALDQHNATEAADSALTAAGSAISSGQTTSSNISTTSDSFRQLNLASMGRSNHKDRLHAVLHALTANGPINFEQGQHRIWFSPYTTVGRTDAAAGQPGNHRWNLGSLAGYEYRNVARKRLIGLILGGLTGLQSVTGTPASWTRTRGVNVGIYAGSDLFEHARVESIVLWIHNALKKQRSGSDSLQGAYAAISKFKQDTIVADLQAFYRFQLNENWSVRPNIGNTYFTTSTGRASEINTKTPISTAASKNQTSQLYSGLGARYQWEMDKITYRITSVFEVGREYYKKGSPIKTAVDPSSLLPPLVSTVSGVTKKVTTKYFTLNGAILDEEKGLKSILSYSGQFTNGSRTHSFMLKVEKRF